VIPSGNRLSGAVSDPKKGVKKGRKNLCFAQENIGIRRFEKV
jgi:hypothetical protein